MFLRQLNLLLKVIEIAAIKAETEKNSLLRTGDDSEDLPRRYLIGDVHVDKVSSVLLRGTVHL